MGKVPSFGSLPLDEARRILAGLKGRGDAESVSTLVEALDSRHWQVKKEAADMLASLGASVAEHLKTVFRSGDDEKRAWIMKIVAASRGREALPWLKKLYSSKDASFRAAVIEAVAVVSGAEATSFLIESLEDESWLNRVAAAGMLERRGKEILKALQKGFLEGGGDLKYWCLRLLVQICGRDAMAFLRKGLASEDPTIRHYVIRSMEDVQDDWVHGLLTEALADENWANRKMAATILQLRGRRAVGDLVTCLRSENLDVVYWAIKALSTIGDERALKPLESLLHITTNQQVISWIISALATFRTAYTARMLIESAYEFPNHSEYIRDRLVDFGVAAVIPLLEYIKSPNRELRLFSRGLLLDLQYPAMTALMKLLDNSSESEFDAFIQDLGKLPDDRLRDFLSGKDVDLGQVHRLAESIKSRTLPAMNTLNVKLSKEDIRTILKEQNLACEEAGGGDEVTACDDEGVPGTEALASPVGFERAGSAVGGASAEGAPRGGAEIDELLKKAVELGASDIHIKTDLPPIFRIQGVLTQTDLAPVPRAKVREYMRRIAGAGRYAVFERELELDLAYEIESVSRYRVNFYSELDGPGIAFRVIPGRVLSLADLRFPRVFKDICNNRQGLILVTGPTGAGKSTTLAAMIDYINQTREEHIITIEDPVEFRHQNRKSIITYRELGTNTHSFGKALRGALRQDPDVILVGEMRDAETINLAMIAAETGHLVLSTLHTMCASETIDRILGQFPPDGHSQITKALAESLRAIISQILVPTVDGRRIPAMEILVKTYAVANLIREEKLNQIDQAIIAGRDKGMQSRDEHLVRLVREHQITEETALTYCMDKNDLLKKLRSAP